MPVTGLCDLHTHSRYSDGTDSPGEIIALAKLQGLSAVALTDHNTVAGLPAFLDAARDASVLAVPGVEISAGYEGKEVHIVGLFLSPEHFEETTLFTNIILQRKEESNRRLAEALNRAGFPLDYGLLLERHAGGNVNRAVIAAALVELGCVGSVEEAFQGILSARRGVYQPPERLSAFDAIRFLSSIGAVPVLAHPFLNFQEPALRRFLSEAKSHGLAAMETRYATFTPEQTDAAREIALQFGLKESGGSDYHGSIKPHIRLGSGTGSLAVPFRLAQAMMP